MISYQPVLFEDEPFLYELYKNIRMNEFTALGWTEEQLDQLLRLQFQMQQQSYARQYPDRVHLLVLLSGQRAGQLMTASMNRQLSLVDISLLPPFRNRGIGTSIIRQLQQQAAHSDQTVRLQVFCNNPALRLYQRLGFRIVEDAFPYSVMEWRSN